MEESDPIKHLKISDITGPNLTENALWLKSLVFDESITAISIAGIDGVIVEVNAAFLHIWGYPDKDEVIGKPLVHFLNNPNDVKAILAALKKSGKWSGEYSAKRKDGSIFMAYGLATDLKDKNGRIVGYQSSAIEVTERKKADEMLVTKNRMLTSINKYTQAIAFTPPEELFATVVTMLKEISGVAEVFINVYDEEKAELVLRKSTLSEENNTWIRKKFGDKLVDARTPVPRDKYDEIMNSPFGRIGSIHEATFGAIPKSVGRIIEKMLGVGWFVGLALKHNERLVGTIMIAGKKGTPELEKEELTAYASVTAGTLAQKHAEVELFQSENRFRSIFEQAAVGIAHVDIDGHFLQVNQKLCSIVGYTRKELLQLNFQDITYPEDLDTDLGLMRNVLDGQIKNYTLEKRYIRKDGLLVWVNLTVVLIRKPSGDPDYGIAVVEDITDRKKAEAQILHLSFHDQLTGLYNRRFFEEELKRLDTKRQLPLSFILGDLNGLKLINDVFGHTEGDSLLVKTAEILKKVCRSDDILARWGGDEFVILLPKTSIIDSEEIVKRIKKDCKNTASQKVPLSLSLGAAIKETQAQNIQAIIIDAESNMYRNKLAQKESISSSVIFALEQALYEKSNETKDHINRVRELALKLGKSINLHSSQIDELSLLASLHDIGKVVISESILAKEGKLTKKEWDVIKRHPEIGFNIASSSPQIAHIAKAILACHENFDGSGYPLGIAGESIPVISRIILISDTYDVMTRGRSYKEPLSKDDKIKELKRCSGTQFDPVLIDKFIEIISN